MNIFPKSGNNSNIKPNCEGYLFMKQKFSKLSKTIKNRFSPLSAFALVAFILLSLTVAAATLPLKGEQELYSGIIRFHVLANSDSDFDQALKLQVRNQVTEYTSALLSNCSNITQAKKIISKNQSAIIKIANRCIAQNGANYTASIQLGTESYPRRTYGKYTFPAGNYYSVRLKLGKAQGANWWCVLFPPMCLGSSTAEKFNNTDELKNIGFSEDQINLISEDTPKTEIRFFFLDLLQNMN